MLRHNEIRRRRSRAQIAERFGVNPGTVQRISRPFADNRNIDSVLPSKNDRSRRPSAPALRKGGTARTFNAQVPDVTSDGVALILIVCISTPIQVFVLALMARQTGASATNYLGLKLPRSSICERAATRMVSVDLGLHHPEHAAAWPPQL
jgi:hypothetical protein